MKKFVPVLANFRFVPLLFPLLSTLVQFSRERVKPRQRDVFVVAELLAPLECTLRYLRILTTSTITILYAVRFWDKAEFVRELSRDSRKYFDTAVFNRIYWRYRLDVSVRLQVILEFLRGEIGRPSSRSKANPKGRCSADRMVVPRI